jgi:hypothetical protein
MGQPSEVRNSPFPGALVLNRLQKSSIFLCGVSWLYLCAPGKSTGRSAIMTLPGPAGPSP